MQRPARQRTYPGCPPIPYLLRDVFPDRWVRFHSLPESQRYATNESEYGIILHRHNAILDHLARSGETLTFASTYGSETAEPVRNVDDPVVVWQRIIDRVLSLYGPTLYYRSVGITQKPNPMARFHTVFPDRVTVPFRHIGYLELLISDSPTCDQLVDWLHALPVPTQRVWYTDSEDDPGTLRIFGFCEGNDVARRS